MKLLKTLHYISIREIGMKLWYKSRKKLITGYFNNLGINENLIFEF